MDTRFAAETAAGVLRFRWFTCNCYELRLPNGKTIVIDPYLVPEEGIPSGLPGGQCGFTTDALEGGDYVLINHTHGDHVATLDRLYDRFQPRVLCHSAVAEHVSAVFDIPPTKIFPFENNNSYDLGDFRLSTLPARHNRDSRPSERPPVGAGTRFEQLNRLGTLYNTNFLIETENHVTVGLCAGLFRPGEAERRAWDGVRCNVFIRQLGGYVLRRDPEGMAEELMGTGASLLLPLHQEKFYDGNLEGDLNDFAAAVNEVLAARGYAGRMLNPERGRWYELRLGAVAV